MTQRKRKLGLTLIASVVILMTADVSMAVTEQCEDWLAAARQFNYRQTLQNTLSGANNEAIEMADGSPNPGESELIGGGFTNLDASTQPNSAQEKTQGLLRFGP